MAHFPVSGYLNHIMKEGDSVVLIHVPEMFDVADATGESHKTEN